MEQNIIETERGPSKTGEYKARLQEYVAEDPMRATLTAVALGFLLSLLPVGRVVMALISLVVHLVRPGLLILGIVKVAELVKERRSEPRP